MTTDIWVLGATGRSGRGIAERLHELGHRVVLGGRNPARLLPLARQLGDAETVTGDLDQQLRQLGQAAPAVVVNTVGPFAQTAKRVVAACPAGTHYVDIANELPAVQDVLDRHLAAVSQRSTFVTGSGFGVLATESLVVKMTTNRPGAARVRVDAIPSLASEEGVIGAALAGSILDGLPAGGRRVEQGKLVRSAVAGQVRHLTTPDGDQVTTGAFPSGDLLAAWRASKAETVVSASSAIPTGLPVRAAMPALSLLSRIAVLRRFGISRLARVPMRAQQMQRQHSWGHCAMQWPDGSGQDGWLQLGDAQVFTIAAAAEVAHRLAAGDVEVGAATPAALFGPSLAVDLGGVFLP